MASHVASTHLVQLAGDITQGLVGFFPFHISIHHHYPPLQIQDTLIVPLLVLQRRRFIQHHFLITWSFLLHDSRLLALQFSAFYQASYCAGSVLLHSLCYAKFYAIFEGSLRSYCLHVQKESNQYKTHRQEQHMYVSVGTSLHRRKN